MPEFNEYQYPVQTLFGKKHIIFGGLAEVESWCFKLFGPDNHIKVVSVQDNWRMTFKFKHERHAVLFALKWT